MVPFPSSGNLLLLCQFTRRAVTSMLVTTALFPLHLLFPKLLNIFSPPKSTNSSTSMKSLAVHDMDLEKTATQSWHFFRFRPGVDYNFENGLSTDIVAVDFTR